MRVIDQQFADAEAEVKAQLAKWGADANAPIPVPTVAAG
jgi:hypothetical protein